MNRPFTWIASAIFALMALVHIYRLIKPFEVTIGSCHLPQWARIVGAASLGSSAGCCAVRRGKRVVLKR
jgi:hypothetical protein